MFCRFQVHGIGWQGWVSWVTAGERVLHKLNRTRRLPSENQNRSREITATLFRCIMKQRYDTVVKCSRMLTHILRHAIQCAMPRLCMLPYPRPRSGSRR